MEPGRAYNYDGHDNDYAASRIGDPRIATCIGRALGDARTIVNVGAGAGSYEPGDRIVAAIEPSGSMRALRVQQGRAPAVRASADSIPFDDGAFDAGMALLTVHHWPSLASGIRELRRVVRDRLVIMTFDPDKLDLLWNVHYFPDVVEVERQRYPKIAELVDLLGGTSDVVSVPVPFDCTDGFQEAFYGRPEAFLDDAVRRNQSAWGFVDNEIEREQVERLRRDLESGAWDRQFGKHRTMNEFHGALRLVVAEYARES